MKITKEQMEKIRKLNDEIKDLDPIIKEKIVDYELYQLLKEDYLKMSSATKQRESPKATVKEAPESHNYKTSESNSSIPTFKEFYDTKKPNYTNETVTVFGFYLEHYKKQIEFSEADISNSFFEARVRKPKAIGQALRDAKNVKGFLVEGSKKGTYRVSNIGENLVIHDLPRKI